MDEKGIGVRMGIGGGSGKIGKGNEEGVFTCDILGGIEKCIFCCYH